MDSKVEDTDKVKVISRKARLSDFLDNVDDPNHMKKYNSKNNNDSIQKNQKEFGQRKRIKP
jgi:hypothetical protein